MEQYDVVIIGYGPTGKVLARQLSDDGHSVAIVERWPSAYPLPRAVGYDHEIKRMFHALGLVEEVEKVSRQMHHYVWYNADWEILVDIDETRESVSGGPTGFLFNQPELERVLEKDLEGRPGIALFLGNEALAIDEHPDRVEVEIAPFDPEARTVTDGPRRRIAGRYLVGCDGANSMVRGKIGSDVFDHGFDAHWLVADFKPHDPDNLELPDAAQWCNPERPTTIVPSGVRMRRFEFMIMPDESPAEIARPENAWKLLANWVKPQDGELIRCAAYNFRSLLAETWRRGRLFIAGDAAHLMPPFMGQGMCSGLRDSWNLGWKLNAVLGGLAPDTLLDSYGIERAPHADALIRLSMEMGKIVCVPDPELAARRDAAFLAGKVPPPPAFPGIADGLVRKNDAGERVGCAGELLAHGELETADGPQRMDELTGRRAVLMTANLDRDELTDRSRALIDELDIALVNLSNPESRDRTGKLTDYLKRFDAIATLARPDFYAFGSASDSRDIEKMLGEFRTGLQSGAQG